jgi:hypothetical protein
MSLKASAGPYALGQHRQRALLVLRPMR